MHPSQAIVHIVDDDRDTLSVVTSLMRSVGLNVKTYTSGLAFLDAFDMSVPGCLVLDLRMPEMSGLEVQDALLEKKLPIPIVFISGCGDVRTAVQAIQKGAVDFIEKPFNHQHLLDVVQRSIRQDVDCHRHRLEETQIHARFASLSERERQVMKSVVEGKANKTTAMELHLSRKTIEIHRAHVMEKMGVDSLVDLIRVSSILKMNLAILLFIGLS